MSKFYGLKICFALAVAGLGVGCRDKSVNHANKADHSLREIQVFGSRFKEPDSALGCEIVMREEYNVYNSEVESAEEGDRLRKAGSIERRIPLPGLNDVVLWVDYDRNPLPLVASLICRLENMQGVGLVNGEDQFGRPNFFFAPHFMADIDKHKANFPICLWSLTYIASDADKSQMGVIVSLSKGCEWDWNCNIRENPCPRVKVTVWRQH